MSNSLDDVLNGRRSLRSALADLRESYRQRPTAQLARMIQQLEAEIGIRRQPARLREQL
jgi:pyrimidine operon attenuation protein/uracil phosphoribosyltransferase